MLFFSPCLDIIVAVTLALTSSRALFGRNLGNATAGGVARELGFCEQQRFFWSAWLAREEKLKKGSSNCLCWTLRVEEPMAWHGTVSLFLPVLRAIDVDLKSETRVG